MGLCIWIANNSFRTWNLVTHGSVEIDPLVRRSAFLPQQFEALLHTLPGLSCLLAVNTFSSVSRLLQQSNQTQRCMFDLLMVGAAGG